MPILHRLSTNDQRQKKDHRGSRHSSWSLGKSISGSNEAESIENKKCDCSAHLSSSITFNYMVHTCFFARKLSPSGTLCSKVGWVGWDVGGACHVCARTKDARGSGGVFCQVCARGTKRRGCVASVGSTGPGIRGIGIKCGLGPGWVPGVPEVAVVPKDESDWYNGLEELSETDSAAWSRTWRASFRLKPQLCKVPKGKHKTNSTYNVHSICTFLLHTVYCLLAWTFVKCKANVIKRNDPSQSACRKIVWTCRWQSSVASQTELRLRRVNSPKGQRWQCLRLRKVVDFIKDFGNSKSNLIFSLVIFYDSCSASFSPTTPHVSSSLFPPLSEHLHAAPFIHPELQFWMSNQMHLRTCKTKINSLVLSLGIRSKGFPIFERNLLYESLAGPGVKPP